MMLNIAKISHYPVFTLSRNIQHKTSNRPFFFISLFHEHGSSKIGGGGRKKNKNKN